MSAKVDQTSAAEHRFVNMAATPASSTASTPGAKFSMFAPKSGFVIPKNKLSGSLVPIFRGGKKPGGNDASNEDSTSQVQRKTKWGPDLTQDTAVMKGRASAYQTRVDQITQQLKSGNLDVGDKQRSPSASRSSVTRYSNAQLDSEKSELLEIERLEAIGEILKLNPSYKTPADYKPLLKEATVPIPVKDYPGYNFAALIFGPGSDTKKRLEKETGAKVQVHGIKANTREKVEISSPDGTEAQDAYEELYVHLSADTFEKVDGAVALIELLVSSVSGNLGSSSVPTSIARNSVDAHSQTLDTAVSSVTDTALNLEVPQLTQVSLQGHLPYHNLWFPTVSTPLNSAVPTLNSPVPGQSTPSNLPSLFGPRPAPAAGYNSIPQNSPFVSSSQHLPRQVSQPYMPQMHPLDHTGPPRTFLVANPNQPSTQSSSLSSLPFTGNQPQALGPLPSTRPSRPLQDQPEVPAGNLTGWSGTSASYNVGQLAPPVHSQVPHPVVPQPVVASSFTAPPNVSSTFAPVQSGPQLSSLPINRPSMPVAPGPPLGSSALPTVLRPPAMSVPMPQPAAMQSSSRVISVTPSPSTSINPPMVSRPILSPLPPTSSSPSLPGGISGSISGNMANFAPIDQPAAITARPQHASSSDFTFQPHQMQGPASPMVSRLGNQAVNPHAVPPRSVVQQQAPQAPSFQFGVPNSAHGPGMQVFHRPQSGNQMGLPQGHIPSSLLTAPPRPPAFPSNGPAATGTPLSQMGLRNFVPSPQTPNMAGPFPSRPGNSLQLQQHYPTQPTRPGNFMSPNPRFAAGHFLQSNRPMPGHSTGQQVYDPFSPTSVSVASQQHAVGKAKARKQENDPEYEDLMASVGVK